MANKKPPPDNPGNLAGRARLRRQDAWARACGGLVLVIDAKGTGRTERAKTYQAPADVEARYLKELVLVEAEFKAKRAKRKRDAKRKPVKGKVNFFTFAKGK